ncbi:hypothetical protein BASA81_004502 [Batrachochytrium salamandrivorans]|nr:hypothetical protein BASA81_004502 [Batrachochytrium salamandrivorans]
MELQQIDPALERLDRLKVREVQTNPGHTASTFLAKFQSIAASLEPDERIKLVVEAYNNSMESLKTVLFNPQANKICSLFWRYDGKEDVNSIIPLLINNCPELASLQVEFGNHFEFDFVSSMLEHPSNRIKVLVLPQYTRGNIPRFFAALGQSQVSAIDIRGASPPGFAQDLCEYLAKDLLVRLKVTMNHNQVPPEMTMSLAKCTRLAQLKWVWCRLSQSTAFPKSITTLTLDDCTFVGGVDWSSLSDSNVQELDFRSVKRVDGNQFGNALAAHLRAKELDMLRLYYCDFADETLAVVGVDIGRIKRLMLEDGRVNDASIAQIAIALKSPNSELQELALRYNDNTASSIETHLVPALKHPDCNLIKLSLPAYQEHREAARRVESKFCDRLALFALLQGRQVRRLYCPLRRLPVEMFRLVGQMLN